MWHLKTKLGTFWIVESDDELHQYFLGCDDDNLGAYPSVDEAVIHVINQETGYLKWDIHPHVQAPESIEQWMEGPPKEWVES